MKKNEHAVYANSPISVDFEEADGAQCNGDNDRRVFDDQGIFWTQQQKAQQPLLMEEMDSKYVNSLIRLLSGNALNLAWTPEVC